MLGGGNSDVGWQFFGGMVPKHSEQRAEKAVNTLALCFTVLNRAFSQQTLCTDLRTLIHTSKLPDFAVK